jgi:hypothetical protein
MFIPGKGKSSSDPAVYYPWLVHEQIKVTNIASYTVICDCRVQKTFPVPKSSATQHTNYHLRSIIESKRSTKSYPKHRTNHSNKREKCHLSVNRESKFQQGSITSRSQHQASLIVSPVLVPRLGRITISTLTHTSMLLSNPIDNVCGAF